MGPLSYVTSYLNTAPKTLSRVRTGILYPHSFVRIPIKINILYKIYKILRCNIGFIQNKLLTLEVNLRSKPFICFNCTSKSKRDCIRTEIIGDPACSVKKWNEITIVKEKNFIITNTLMQEK